MHIHVSILEMVLKNFHTVLRIENTVDWLVLNFSHAHDFPLVDKFFSQLLGSAKMLIPFGDQ